MGYNNGTGVSAEEGGVSPGTVAWAPLNCHGCHCPDWPYSIPWYVLSQSIPTNVKFKGHQVLQPRPHDMNWGRPSKKHGAWITSLENNNNFLSNNRPSYNWRSNRCILWPEPCGYTHNSTPPPGPPVSILSRVWMCLHYATIALPRCPNPIILSSFNITRCYHSWDSRQIWSAGNPRSDFWLRTLVKLHDKILFSLLKGSTSYYQANNTPNLNVTKSPG